MAAIEEKGRRKEGGDVTQFPATSQPSKAIIRIKCACRSEF
jgi:hypothetical protein